MPPQPSTRSATSGKRKWIGALLLIVTIMLGGKTYSDTFADPEVRRATIALEGMPAGQPPIRAVLLADIHVAGPDMPPSRVTRIVEQVNALKPDIIFLPGDLVSDRTLSTKIYSPEEIVAPLAALRAPLGVILTPGNHDHWFDWPALAGEARKHGIHVLENEAASFGPLAIGGVDDAHTGHDDLAATLQAMDGLEGGRLLLTHSPDVFPDVPGDIALTLAGHTHCGQIVLPLIGTIASSSRYGDRYLCGMIEEDGRTMIVTSGLGNSVLPFRFGARPDIWLIELTAQ